MQVGLAQSLSSIVKAANIAKKYEWYGILIVVSMWTRTCSYILTSHDGLAILKIGHQACKHTVNLFVFLSFSSYHFLVYNASVLLWQICRPFQHQGTRRLFVKPLQSVVRALEECKERDYDWRLELLVYDNIIALSPQWYKFCWKF